jgi:hypothetical protein
MGRGKLGGALLHAGAREGTQGRRLQDSLATAHEHALQQFSALFICCRNPIIG